MTEYRLKEVLRAFKQLQIQLTLWEHCPTIINSPTIQIEYAKRYSQFRIISNAIEILNDMEKFVIENHLVNHKTWRETAILFELQWGTENSRSDRTLKRIQHRALQKMVAFIKSSKINFDLDA